MSLPNAELVAHHFEQLTITLTQLNAADVLLGLTVEQRQRALETLTHLAQQIDTVRDAVYESIPREPVTPDAT